MARILKGAEVVSALNDRITAQAEELKAGGITPTLGILRVGARPDDLSYERGAMKRCEKLGVAVKQTLLPEDVDQESLLAAIREMNRDAGIHGVLMFRPLPKHLNEEEACQTLDPAKDVDGITYGSLAGVFTGQELGYPPCTPAACMEILDHFGIDCTGKKAVVVGRSLVVGRPAAMMLLKKNATVTLCHTRTVDMPALCREADILIVAAGQAGVADSRYFAPGQIVIDVGIHVNGEGQLCGDCRFEDALEIVDAITPVPGGVGTVTTSVLVGHVVEAAARQNS